MKTAVVIPARYGSMRFPGKVLAMLRGKPIVQWVWECAMKSKADLVLVATDDDRVYKTVESFGGKAVMTSPNHPSGSDRIMEAVKDIDADIIINVQGDEPSMPPELIDRLIDLMSGADAPDMGTVIVPCKREDVADNPNKPKVVISADGYALYFSRAMIPFLREGGTEMKVYRHWGIYAYQRAALERFVSLPEGNLEKCEKLEQLRALENGMRIKTIETTYDGVDVNTPEDLEEAEKLFAGKGL
ncbi:MAG: 3-deoxy-manno-octulosonate cytidylyltransferase [Lentisphaeria bacterium]|nr:3-deoxy-manno-octulosonate cytidylyltransferase [Lentisphaerota bacterium]MBO5695752.1 3-deoxy-manno-octulosonate cytidylyltransferase [Lentisphaeria bacterium]MBR4884242.1 3-deoxy-manno-octulosonate cytidylyltransferase [Lentisphaeria bacterium]